MKQSFFLTYVVFFIMTFGVHFGHGQTKFSPVKKDSLNLWMNQLTEKYDIPGLTIAIVGDTILNVDAVGVRKLGNQALLTTDDFMMLASCGKALTGTVSGRLVEKKKINWDTKFFDLFPKLRKTSKSEYSDITLNQLLSHRARLMQFTEKVDYGTIDKKFHRNRYAFAKWLLSQNPVDIDTANGYKYSNAGYALAALMMEKVSGKSWHYLVKEELEKPLGITVKYGWPALIDPNYVWGHLIKDGDSTLTIDSLKNDHTIPYILEPAGCYIISTKDYAKFLLINLKGLQGEHFAFLKPETFAFMHYCNMQFSPYSIGWGAFKRNNILISTHTGGITSFKSHVILFKELNLAIGILANAETEDLQSGIGELLGKIFNYYHLDL